MVDWTEELAAKSVKQSNDLLQTQKKSENFLLASRKNKTALARAEKNLTREREAR